MDKEIIEKERQEQIPLVSIFTLTYNHAPYIRQCLDGFLMQKTDFPFEVIVNDDASIDGTTEIVREYERKYPEIIKPIYHSENCFSKGERGFWSRYCLPKSRGKYIALCEGDDYWIDPLKLQKQVDFLEANPEYGLVHTYFNYVDTQSRVIPPPEPFYEKLQARVFDGYVWDYYLVNPGFILTCTCMFRRSLYRKEEQTFFDHGLFMMIARQSKVHCLREVTAAYRRNPDGAIMTNNQYYIQLSKRVRLYQIYYFIKKRFVESYYWGNSDVWNNVIISFAHIVIDFFRQRLDRKDIRLLFEIISVKHSLIFSAPAFILANFFRK